MKPERHVSMFAAVIDIYRADKLHNNDKPSITISVNENSFANNDMYKNGYLEDCSLVDQTDDREALIRFSLNFGHGESDIFEFTPLAPTPPTENYYNGTLNYVDIFWGDEPKKPIPGAELQRIIQMFEGKLSKEEVDHVLESERKLTNSTSRSKASSYDV